MKRRKKKLTVKRTRKSRSFRPFKKDAIRIGPLPWKPITGLLAAVILVSCWVRYDPAGWFRLQTIAVTGPTKHLTVEEITELVAPTLGVPLMSLDLEPIRQRVEEHKWIRSVGLRRLLPGTLYVHVLEHQPAAIIAFPEPYLVSSEGVYIKKVGPEDSRDLPIVTGLQPGPEEAQASLLQRRIVDSLAVMHALQATGALEPFGLSEVHWEDGRILSLTTQQPAFQITLGAAPWRKKINRLIHVLPHIMSKGKYPMRISLDQNEGVIVRYSQLAERKL